MGHECIQLIVGATYDVLPTPQNLGQWVGEDGSCCVLVLQVVYGIIETYPLLVNDTHSKISFEREEQKS